MQRIERSCGFEGDIGSDRFCPNNSWRHPVGCPATCAECPCDKCEHCLCIRDNEGGDE